VINNYTITTQYFYKLLAKYNSTSCKKENYEGNFLRKIKRISLALLSIPVLFTGCMQERVSKIIPPKSTDNVVKFDAKDKNQTLTIENNSSVKNNVINKTIDNKDKPSANNMLDNLALSVLANLDIEIKGDEQLVSQALEVGDNWEVITKEDEILETAKEFIGVKYVWAANGPSAFDCSGFTKYVFEKHGVTIPRYSGHQANIGTKVAYNELQKGDLVFFDTDKKGKVNHVGIFLGDHKFIHASSGGKKVMITSFITKKFYKNRFLHGQRIINSSNTLTSL
jgi:cell wall-associated NlpC family hydrolase